ncbi:transglutaminase domain-containing protein, partial [Paenibacillus macerans]|nr:transglutaminase domain-containing protein [Paenibacillus macerans]
MMEDLLQSVREYNFISLLLLFILLGSILQGLLRGASRSAGRLFSLLSGGVLSLLGIAAAIPLTLWIYPKVQEWLSMLAIPQRELALWEQVFYT